ncbi:hypothetical protein J6590_103174 [Homalodisca vitripennis]|nr:hypothetical protein J6590_103174 [Homalodisca vitripennis]
MSGRNLHPLTLTKALDLTIPTFVLKYCSNLLTPHLTVLFNYLGIGVFPKSLKTSFVVPIPKSSNIAEVSNYRHIVIQPALGKIQRLQKFQDRSMRVIGVKIGYDYLNVQLRLVEESLGLCPLMVRIQLHNLTFLQKILIGELDSPDLLVLFNLRVPGRPPTSSAVSRVLTTET